MGYTLGQLRLYLGAVERGEAREALRGLMIARAAQAEPNGYRQVWEALERSSGR